MITVNKLIILNYINRLKKEDIENYSLRENTILNKEEIDIIYDYIKNHFDKIVNNPIKVLNEVKDKVSTSVYDKILELYDKYKDMIDKLK